MQYDTSFPSPELTAIADPRYVNRYNYFADKDVWVLILDAKRSYEPLGKTHTNTWQVVEVDPVFGVPTGEPFTTEIDLWAGRFSDRPFDVFQDPTEKTIAWFMRVVEGKYDNLSELEALYTAYIERLAFNASYMALRRIGIECNLILQEN